MSDYEPRPGDRVRVVLEGQVSEQENADTFVGIGEYGEGLHVTRKRVMSVEKMPDPEPEWRPGDIALDADGKVNVYVGGRMWRPLRGPGGSIHGNWSLDVRVSQPVRPLTPLLVDGKPVAS